MLKIWGRKTSSNVQALMWCVGELGLEYQRIDVGHRYGGTDAPEFIEMNPNQTVPVLQDGDGLPLWETGAIMRHLARCYANETFWPKDLNALAQVDKWAEWAKLNIAQAFSVPIFWRVVRTAPKDRDNDAILSAIASLESKLQIAEKQLQAHDYLAGQEFSLADIQFGHVLFRYYDIDIVRADLPALRAYYESLSARPAFVEHVMISYEELRVI